MKVFVTGGTGFIGPYVVRELSKRGHKLFILSSHPKSQTLDFPKTVEFVEGDLADIESWKPNVKSFQPEATIHMAWEGIPDYSVKTSIKNLKYGLNLFEELAELGCKKIICTGSCWEYGQQSGKLREDMMLKPYDAFTAAKNALHWMGREIAKENNMQFIWTRLFYVYGPGQKETCLIPYLINCIKQGKKPEIKTSFAKNDFVCVEDAADAVTMILEKCKQSTIYNIGSGYSTNVQDIIKIVCDNYDFQYESMSAHPTSEPSVDFWADISKIKMEVGWKPKLTIPDGLQKTIQEYKK